MLYYYIDARKWFQGPKITVDLDQLTEEQEEALRDEGLQVEGLEGQGVVGGRRSSVEDTVKTT